MLRVVGRATALVLLLILGTPALARVHAQDSARAARADADSTVDDYRAAIARARSVGDSAALAAAHNSIGLLHWRASQYDSARVHLTQSRDLRIALGDRRGLGLVLNSLGATHYQSGVYEPALEAFLASLEMHRVDGNARAEAIVLGNIGKTYHDWRQYDRARVFLEEALAVAERVGNPVILGYSLHNLGMLHIDAGDYARARDELERSLRYYTSPDPRVSRADSGSGWALNMTGLGMLLVREGDPVSAIAILRPVLAVAERAQRVRGQAQLQLYLGRAYRAAGERQKAIDALRRSLELSRSVVLRAMTLETLSELAEVEQEDGRTRVALEHLRAFNALRDTIFDQSTAQRIAAMEARNETERQLGENARLVAEQGAQELVITRQRRTVLLGTSLLVIAIVLVGMLARLNRELRTALSEVRTLEGLIPICARCKKVRDDQGYWEGVETYISSRSDALFSHSICTSCGPELYGEDWHHAEATAEGKHTEGTRADAKHSTDPT